MSASSKEDRHCRAIHRSTGRVSRSLSLRPRPRRGVKLARRTLDPGWATQGSYQPLAPAGRDGCGAADKPPPVSPSWALKCNTFNGRRPASASVDRRPRASSDRLRWGRRSRKAQGQGSPERIAYQVWIGQRRELAPLSGPGRRGDLGEAGPPASAAESADAPSGRSELPGGVQQAQVSILAGSMRQFRSWRICSKIPFSSA